MNVKNKDIYAKKMFLEINPFWPKPQKSAIFSASLQNISIQLLSNFTDTLVSKIPCGFVKNQFTQTD